MEVDVSGSAVRGFPRREIASFVNACQRELEKLRLSRIKPRSLSIVFVDDETMTALNARYRSKRKTTDVLTFPAASGKENLEDSLGEIVISLDQAKRQAREEGHSVSTELRYLLLHGMLHAHGYDHESDDGTMNRIELEVRSRVGLS